MDESSAILMLKDRLRRRVSSFAHDERGLWRKPIVKLFQTIRRQGWDAVLFGGVLRTLLSPRRGERPRDVDLVLDVPDIRMVAEHLGLASMRFNRYGGLRVEEPHAHFDLWPAAETWAFKSSGFHFGNFEQLPLTTFLDIEAIAIDLWPRH